MDATKPAGRLASPLTEVLGLVPKRANVGDTVECDVRHPYPQTHRLVLETTAAAAFASKLLATPGSGWRLAAVAAMLTGCSQMTQPSDIEVAQELCGQRGGFTHVSRFEHGQNLLINCKDGTYIDVRLAKKA